MMEDTKIVDLYLRRDESAIQHTSEKYGEKLRRIAEHILFDPETSKECENDTYLNAWNRIPPAEPRNYLFAFLAKIIRCSAIDRVKLLSRQKRAADFVMLTEEIESAIPAGDGPEAAAEAAELSRVISAFLRGTGEEKRRVFLRRYWFMDSVGEIAERYGMAESRVKTILYRTRRELKAYLEKEGYSL